MKITYVYFLLLLNLFWGGSIPSALSNSNSSKLPTDFLPYSLPYTEVRQLYSKLTGIGYILYISLPRGHKNEANRYPVVFTLDADYSFALAHNIIEHFVDRHSLPQMIVVSIAYKGASQNKTSYRLNRTRDYTPTYSIDGPYPVEIKKVSGGGGKFLSFIIEELIPFVEANYRVKENDRTIVGHSFGGLFGAYVLFTKPTTFQRYILISPSLWYDNNVIFEFESHYAETHDSLKARVFFGIGSYENNRHLMVDDMKKLIIVMQSRLYKGLEVNSFIFERETHGSVFPAALSRGLRVVF